MSKRVDKKLPPNGSSNPAEFYNRSLIEASLDPLVTIGRDGKITDVNRATEETTGQSREDLIGTDFSEYFTDPARARAGYLRVFEEGQVRDYPLEIRHPNGNITPVLYNASIFRDQSGNVAGVFAAARDITERHRAEEALRTASAYNRSLIEASLDPLVTIGRDGKITDVNRATEEVTGHSRRELIGTDFSDYFTDPTSARTGYLRVFEAGEVRDYPLEIRHQDGQIIPVLYNASVYRDSVGNVIGVFAAARDITLERYRTLYEQSPDGVMLIDTETTKAVEFNNTMNLMLGYSREEFTNLTIADYDSSESFERIKELIEKTKAGKRETFETIYQTKTREKRHVLVTIQQIKITGNLLIHAIVRDITKLKQAEANLAQTIDALKRSNAELEQFAYVASHDLQEPLRMVSSFVQLLAERYKEKLDPEANKFINIAVESATRMQELIKDLLAFSRLATRGQPFERIDSKIVLDQVIKDLAVVIEESKSKISIGSLPIVFADPVQLGQVFQNLISNAIKFRSTRSPEVQVGARQGKEEWIFSIQDNGIGIDPKYFDKIFVIFRRLHPRDKYPGTGIGLATCKKIVERHGGRIWVESEPGKGCTFNFSLPSR